MPKQSQGKLPKVVKIYFELVRTSVVVLSLVTVKSLIFNFHKLEGWLKKLQTLRPLLMDEIQLPHRDRLRGDSLLFTGMSLEIPDAPLIDLWRMKGWVDLGATKWFWTQDPSTANPVPYSPYIKIRDVEERWSAKTQR